MSKPVFSISIILVAVAAVSLWFMNPAGLTSPNTATEPPANGELGRAEQINADHAKRSPSLPINLARDDDSSSKSNELGETETVTMQNDTDAETHAEEDLSNNDDVENNAASQADERTMPGEEIGYALKIGESDFHNINGSATSSIGNIQFDSKLLPSNEVRLQLSLESTESEPVMLTAYFDLANFVMELDGGNAVLGEEHKELLRVSNAQLTSKLIEQFEDYGVPEHGFMLVQMLSYWSESPKGYVHEKHVSVRN
jgi:hypothetical protein